MFVPVQIFDDEFVESVAPAGIIPTAPPPDADGFVPLVGFAVTQTAAMALVSILGLRVRASRRADAVSVAA